MRQEGNLMCATVFELARYLGDNIIKDDEGEFISIPECDFCIVDDDNAKYTLKELHSKAEGWYGLKVVNGGFDSNCLVVMTDYYGGGCANIAQIWDDGIVLSDEITQDLCRTIGNTLNMQELTDNGTVLLVEFLSKKKYTVSLNAFQHGQIEVEAESKEQAEEIAAEMYQNGEVLWHGGELTDLTVKEKNI